MLLRRLRCSHYSIISTMALSTTANVATTDTPEDLINRLNDSYKERHVAYESNFWSTKMALKGHSFDALTDAKKALDDFLGDKTHLDAVRAALKKDSLTHEQRTVLSVMERTFLCNIMENAEAASLRDSTSKLEAELEKKRNVMKLGYTDPTTGTFKAASTVALRTIMVTHEDEAVRKAAFEGMQSVSTFVTPTFVEIVKARNRMAKLLGHEDFYQFKVLGAEGFGKDVLFNILDGLEARTRPLMEKQRAEVARRYGDDALQPWNMGFKMAGSTTKEQDPYLPFSNAVSVWATAFSRMGIHYRDAFLRLDLCDREGKYSNGFCHWPVPAYFRADGSWCSSAANFTSLATPNQVGSGMNALTTLLHEGGHAAHMANITQHSPFCSQERAPMSVAYAENQSMFLDSLIGDAAFLGRYAKTTSGDIMPFDIVEKGRRLAHLKDIFVLRSMIVVPYFEKALYELPEDQITVENVLKLADNIEHRIYGGANARPVLSIPHILSDESSCYYHGYTLAELSVHQTRKYFLTKYDQIVDNPAIGADLEKTYWRPGNTVLFLSLVEQLTGKPLSSDAWVERLESDIEEVIKLERAEYSKAVLASSSAKASEMDSLEAHVQLVHGDTVIADSKKNGGIQSSCNLFAEWVQREYFTCEGAESAAKKRRMEA